MPRLQRAERLLRDLRGDVGGDVAARIRFVHHDQPARVLDALEHRVHLERRERAQVDDLALDALLRERLRPLRCARCTISP